MNRSTVVAVVNSNPDVVRLLRTAIEQAGFVVVTSHIEDIKTGGVDLRAFLRDHDPKVMVYDIAPPYQESWRFLDHVKNAPEMEGRRFVITSVNPERVRAIVGSEESVYEVVGEKDDLDAIVRAVKEASRARPTR